jgi:hypothetical protein
MYVTQVYYNHEISTIILSILAYCPRILLHRIVHVKDDGEEAPPSNRHTTLNMSQATEQMVDQRNSQPKILLKRVCLKK